MKNFSERLEWAMANAKKTRKDLSLVIDASVQAIGQVLNSDGKKNFTAVNCAESAKYLGVDFYWLATGKGSPLQPAIADGLIEIEAASQAVRRLYRSQQSVGERLFYRPNQEHKPHFRGFFFATPKKLNKSLKYI